MDDVSIYPSQISTDMIRSTQWNVMRCDVGRTNNKLAPKRFEVKCASFEVKRDYKNAKKEAYPFANGMNPTLQWLDTYAICYICGLCLCLCLAASIHSCMHSVILQGIDPLEFKREAASEEYIQYIHRTRRKINVKAKKKETQKQTQKQTQMRKSRRKKIWGSFFGRLAKMRVEYYLNSGFRPLSSYDWLCNLVGSLPWKITSIHTSQSHVMFAFGFGFLRSKMAFWFFLLFHITFYLTLIFQILFEFPSHSHVHCK